MLPLHGRFRLDWSPTSVITETHVMLTFTNIALSERPRSSLCYLQEKING